MPPCRPWHHSGKDHFRSLRVYHTARDIDEIIRTRLEGVGQGAPLIPHEEVVREFEERRRGEKPDQPEAA